MGQRQDNKLSDADINNTWTSLDLTNFPAEEFRPLYRVIVRTASGYGNTPKAYFAQVDDARLDHIAVSGAAGGSGTINANTDLNAIPFYSDATIGGNALSSSKIIYTPQLVSENGISNIGGDFLLSTDNNSANSSQILIQDGTSGTIVLKSQLSYVTVQRRGSSGLLKLDGESGFIYTENSSNLTLTADGTYDASINLNATSGRITLNPGSTEVVQCQGDLDLTTGVIGTSTTNGGIELEVNGTGAIYLNGPLETNATTGTPVDDTTPVSWLKVTVGASDYYLPLYQ
jgi:hypothetical protein